MRFGDSCFQLFGDVGGIFFSCLFICNFITTQRENICCEAASHQSKRVYYIQNECVDGQTFGAHSKSTSQCCVHCFVNCNCRHVIWQFCLKMPFLLACKRRHFRFVNVNSLGIFLGNSYWLSFRSNSGFCGLFGWCASFFLDRKFQLNQPLFQIRSWIHFLVFLDFSMWKYKLSMQLTRSIFDVRHYQTKLKQNEKLKPSDASWHFQIFIKSIRIQSIHTIHIELWTQKETSTVCINVLSDSNTNIVSNNKSSECDCK